MKKILYFFVATLILFTSCDNEQDSIFDDSPETRINNVLTKYKTTLTKDDGNWIAYYSGSAILMKFKDDNTVEFKSTYGDGSDDKTISYRIGITQVPELIFESHSVFQAIYEDNRATGEYEFLFDKVTDKRIDFISKTDRGVNKTKLTFFKGTEADLVKTKELTNKISVLSVFKEVVINGDTKHKIAISLNSGGKAQVNTLVDGKTKIENYNYDVTANGIIFQPALKIGDNVEASEFTFDETNSIFQSTDEKSVTIKMVNVPAVPLTPYAFGKIKNNGRYNYLEKSKSSQAFVDFYNAYVTEMAGYGLQIQKWYLRSLSDTDVPYLSINTNVGEIWYEFTFEIKEDGKVYFTIGDTNSANVGGYDMSSFAQPLVDKLFNTNGHYIEDTGGLMQYPNGTFSLINADDPSLMINFYDF